MNNFRDMFFTNSRFSDNQNGNICRRHLNCFFYGTIKCGKIPNNSETVFYGL